MLFVRRQRLQSVGGFSLLLLHCLSHVKIKDMSSDSSPAFQRIFFKVQTRTQSVNDSFTFWAEILQREYSF